MSEYNHLLVVQRSFYLCSYSVLIQEDIHVCLVYNLQTIVNLENQYLCAQTKAQCESLDSKSIQFYISVLYFLYI